MSKINSILFVSLFTACTHGPVSDDPSSECASTQQQDLGEGGDGDGDGMSTSSDSETGEGGSEYSPKFDLLDVPDAPPIIDPCDPGSLGCACVDGNCDNAYCVDGMCQLECRHIGEPCDTVTPCCAEATACVEIEGSPGLWCV